MKESIRNQFPGTIKSIVSDKVLSEVIVETASGEVASVITTHSVEDMTGRKFLHEGLFGLCVSAIDSSGRTIFVGDAMALEAGGTGKNEK
jgi:molybdopterin-binding protein